MALLTYIDPENPFGARALLAAQKIREALGDLKELDGMRAETIAGDAGGAANFEEFWGVHNTTEEPTDHSEAQALSDRMGALAGGVMTGIVDFANTTLPKEVV